MTLKRIFDIIFSTTALVLLSPLLLLVALLIKLESKGPAIYVSKRVGQGYKIFDLFKFRTMATDADRRLGSLLHLNQYGGKQQEEETGTGCSECARLGRPCSPTLYYADRSICEREYLQIKQKTADGTFVKIKDDPRITQIGRFIRNTSIDELPQLYNVLIGDMSMVGNRPLPLYEAEKLTSDKAALRFAAPAGLTGLWQVSKRGRGEMSPDERIQLDNEYAEKWGFFTDLKLILKTIPALLQSENV